MSNVTLALSRNGNEKAFGPSGYEGFFRKGSVREERQRKQVLRAFILPYPGWLRR